MRISLMIVALLMLTVILSLRQSCWADSGYKDGQDSNDEYGLPEADVKKGPAKSSNSSFDRRLPPVLPGETIEGHGQKMKVWSTAGSDSPVQEPPHPPQPRGFAGPEGRGLGIIVDRRRSGVKSPEDPVVPVPVDPDEAPEKPSAR